MVCKRDDLTNVVPFPGRTRLDWADDERIAKEAAARRHRDRMLAGWCRCRSASLASDEKDGVCHERDRMACKRCFPRGGWGAGNGDDASAQRAPVEPDTF